MIGSPSWSVRLSIQVKAMGVAWSAPCGRYLLAPLAGSKDMSKEIMVLGDRPTPTRFPTYLLCTSVNKTPLRSSPSVRRLSEDGRWLKATTRIRRAIHAMGYMGAHRRTWRTLITACAKSSSGTSREQCVIWTNFIKTWNIWIAGDWLNV